MKKIYCAATLFALSTASAHAATLTTADFLAADGMTNLTRNVTENDSVQVYTEQTGVAIEDGQVTVDYLAADLAPGAQTFGIDTFSAGSALAAGTYDSFLVHFDPQGGGNIADVVIDFGANIVALILTNTGGGTTLLNTSDGIFGTAGTYDNHLGRRTESNDSFSLMGSELTLISLTTNSSHVDNIRVLTAPAAVPVPAAGLLLLTALGGAAALRRRGS